MDSDVQALTGTVQKLTVDLQNLHAQVNELHGELRAHINDMRSYLGRMEQALADNSSFVKTIHISQDVTRGEVSHSQSTLESKIGNLDNKLDHIHSSVKEVRSKLR